MGTSIFYRPYKNIDGSGLCKSWNRSGYAKILGTTIDEHVFDQFIASKLIFDPAHLIVAVDSDVPPDPWGMYDGRVVGFVHGGFGPNKTFDGPDKSTGYIAMLVVEQREDQQEIRSRLLFEMEKVFFQMGIQRVYAGSVYPNAPFYSGRLFGFELNGVQENDPFLPLLLLRNHYIPVERHHILTFPLCSHIPLNFTQRSLAQTCELYIPGETNSGNRLIPKEIMALDWWELCTHAQLPWTRCVLLSKDERKPIAWMGVRVLKRDEHSTVLGLQHLFVKEEFRKRGYAKLFMLLVLNHLYRKFQSCTVELQVPEKNTSALQTFTGLHFEIISTGNVYRRDLPVNFLEEVIRA